MSSVSLKQYFIITTVVISSQLILSWFGDIKPRSV